MATQATPTRLGLDNFHQEQIMQRLRSQAMRLWGLQDADAENLDPVIDLLLGGLCRRI